MQIFAKHMPCAQACFETCCKEDEPPLPVRECPQTTYRRNHEGTWHGGGRSRRKARLFVGEKGVFLALGHDCSLHALGLFYPMAHPLGQS